MGFDHSRMMEPKYALKAQDDGRVVGTSWGLPLLAFAS